MQDVESWLNIKSLYKFVLINHTILRSKSMSWIIMEIFGRGWQFVKAWPPETPTNGRSRLLSGGWANQPHYSAVLSILAHEYDMPHAYLRLYIYCINEIHNKNRQIVVRYRFALWNMAQTHQIINMSGKQDTFDCVSN